MLTYLIIGILQVHERDQDTDLALLIVRKFIRTVSPHVRLTLVYFYTARAEGSNFNNVITTIKGHVDEYPTMHYLGNPRYTQSMIAYMILTRVFPEIPVKSCIVGMLLTSPIVLALILCENCRAQRLQRFCVVSADYCTDIAPYLYIMLTIHVRFE